MLSTRSSVRRGGALIVAIAGIAAVSVGTAAVLSFSPDGGAIAGGSAVGHAKEKSSGSTATRKLQPGEVATVLHLLGISPEAMAAAGITGLGSDGIFDTATAYCLQAERLTQLQIAHGNVNLANAKAVRPSAPGAVDGSGHQLTIAQCQTALDDLENAGFAFVTSGLGTDTVTKLSKIRANKHWGLPMPYMTVDRTDPQWLALRGALVARRFADSHGATLNETPAGVLSTAEADATVSQALTDFAANLAGVKESWASH